MGSGSAQGEVRAVEASVHALSNCLLDLPIDQARGILVNVTGGPNLGLYEVNQAIQVLGEAARPDAKWIGGSVIDEAMGDTDRVTIIATGYVSKLLWR